MNEQFQNYASFFHWLVASYPEDVSTTEKGTSFRDFVSRLLPETARGHRFGPLKPNPKHSHDRGVDVVSEDPTTDQLALQTKFAVSEKKHLDEILSKFKDYESGLDQNPDGRLFRKMARLRFVRFSGSQPRPRSMESGMPMRRRSLSSDLSTTSFRLKADSSSGTGKISATRHVRVPVGTLSFR